jgi:general secretion pathway protein F
MPNFTYRAKSGPSKIITGIIQADNDKEAVAKILQSGHTPLEVKLQISAVASNVSSRQSKNDGSKAPLPTVAIFTRQMCDMVDAGIPLLRCLEILIHQNQHPSMLIIIESMHEFVKGGGSLSGALAQFPQTFPLLYINMVKSGELGGYLPQVLNRLADFIEKDIEIRSQIKGSLLYPAIIFLVGVLTMFVLLTFVLPKLTVMFEDFDTALPLPTQIVIAISGFFARFWWLIVLAVGAGVYLMKRWLKTVQGRRSLENFILKVPLLAPFVRNAQMALFSRTMGTLLESGVSISSALESVTETIDNVLFKEELQRITQKVKGGSSLTAAVKGCPFFSEVAINLIVVGEEGGKLEKGLYKLATMCERATAETARNFVTILGPVVLVVIVAIVGFVIVSMLLPMFRMNMIIN